MKLKKKAVSKSPRIAKKSVGRVKSVPKKPRITVLIADDHSVVREGLVSLITRKADMIVIGEAGNGREAVDLWKRHHPNVTLLDLRMPELDGVGALKGIIKNTTFGTALHTKFDTQGKLPEVPRPWQENLLHIGQEALTNTLKYAHARNFETRLSYKARELRLQLRDDGDGFKVKERHDGAGLTGMRERVEQMGGELKISSLRGKGTKITIVLPFNGESMS